MKPDTPKTLTITIAYDNNAYDPELTTDWGFAALLHYKGHALLFDTGADGAILLNNLKALDLELASIEQVVLSHPHDDHTGGLQGLLAAGAKPTGIYLHRSFPDDLNKHVPPSIKVLETGPGMAISEGIRVTGQMSGKVPEQALMVDTDRGLVILTGCAHPGVVQIAKRAQELTGKSIHLILGGFHLRSASKGNVRQIIDDLRHLGVEKVAPCHCTGEEATALFARAYGDDFIATGAGRVITL